MKEQKNLTPEQSLEIIKQHIFKTKENIRRDITPYLVWGWAVVLTSLVNYGLFYYDSSFKYSNLLWPVVMSACAIYTMISARKDYKEQRYETYHENFLKKLWTVLGGTIFFIAFALIGLELLSFVPIFVFIISGCGMLISGWVLNERWFIFGGVVLYIATALTYFIYDADLLLLSAAAYFLGYIIPAYIIKRQPK